MVIVCDCQYRSSITAIRTFAKLGKKVIAVTTEENKKPPSFSSRYIYKKIVFSAEKEIYKEQLLKLCMSLQTPIIFPCGNFTLNILSENVDDFKIHSHFLVAPPITLSHFNDKKWVKNEAIKNGINVPREYTNADKIDFPAVVKPFCGEKFNLKAANRYKIVNNKTELEQALEFFKPYDTNPIIEKYINGDGIGVSVLAKQSNVITAFSHKRLTEFPVNGGPSSSLITIKDNDIINACKNFLQNTDFSGIAMFEFKKSNGKYYLLEINPRVWGSFPATEKASSDFLKRYVDTCFKSDNAFFGEYAVNKKIKFTRGLIGTCISSIKQRKIKKFFTSLSILLNPFIPDAIFSFSDPIPAIKDFFRR